MKILRPVCAGVAGVFFPIGPISQGGTCEHSSKKCINQCYASKDKDYDITLDISEEDKGEIYRLITEYPAVSTCVTILREMDELQAKVLSWFTSGDCPNKDVKKIYTIMHLLAEEGLIQNGFTRNKTLYKQTKENPRLGNIILTLDSLKDLDRSALPQGLYAVPNYRKGETKLYYGTPGYYYTVGGCGWNEVRSKNFEGIEVTIATNCLGCYKKNIGCFHKG